MTPTHATIEPRPGRLRACAAGLLLVLAACGGTDRVPEGPPRAPEDAIRQLVDDLRHDDLEAYARHALPPELHARLETAWREGRTTWPLTELPLHAQLPGFLASLAAPDAEKSLRVAYQRQFAGAHAELRSAATTMGLFATRYVAANDDYSPYERSHYMRLIDALSDWGRKAPLGDPIRARQAIPALVAGARLTGLDDPTAFGRDGMDRTLRRLGPFARRLKDVLAEHYGLDLDAALDSVGTRVLFERDDRARVRVHYTVAGHTVEATVRLHRRDGRWYLTDLVRHAEAEASAGLPAPATTAQAAATAPAVPATP